jgi:hypothetical protein
MTALGRRELALSTMGTVVRQQHFDFGKMEKEVPGMPFGAAVRCMVAIQESGILSLVLSCKRLREDGRVVERVVGALKMRIAVTYNGPAQFLGWATVVGQPTLAQARQIVQVINLPEAGGWTRLTRCFEIGRGDAMRLIEYGGDVNGVDTRGMTPLLSASTVFGTTDVVRALLDAGAELNFQAPTGWTALMYATVNSKADIVDLLLQQKANVNAKNKLGQTALQLAKTDLIRDRLIKAGAVGFLAHAAGRFVERGKSFALLGIPR